MTISNAYPATSAYQANAFAGFRQKMQDFKGLANALQSGDISSAQSAFATVQNDLQSAQSNGKTSPLLDQNTPVGKDFQTLQAALKSGDIKAAQDAFATLTQDMRKAHGHHNAKRADNDGDADDGGTQSAASSTDSSSDVFSQVSSPALNVTA
jgi:ribosomal protein S20